MGSDHRCSFRSPVCVCVLWLAVPPWLTDFGGSAAFIMSGLGKVCPFVPVNLAQYHRVGDTGLGKVCLLCASGSGTVSWGWLNLGRICTSLPVNLAQYQWYGWGEVGGDVCWCGDRCCWGEFWVFFCWEICSSLQSHRSIFFNDLNFIGLCWCALPLSLYNIFFQFLQVHNVCSVDCGCGVFMSVASYLLICRSDQINESIL